MNSARELLLGVAVGITGAAVAYLLLCSWPEGDCWCGEDPNIEWHERINEGG